MLNKTNLKEKSIKGFLNKTAYLISACLLIGCLVFIFAGIFRYSGVFNSAIFVGTPAQPLVTKSPYVSLDEYIEIAFNNEQAARKKNATADNAMASKKIFHAAWWRHLFISYNRWFYGTLVPQEQELAVRNSKLEGVLGEANHLSNPTQQVEFIFLDIGKLTENEDSALNIIKSQSLFKQKEEVRRMQKLSWTIAQDHNLPLPYTEKIVLETWRAANRHGLSPYLLLALVGVESSYQQFSRSGAGAIGLTQIIPKWHPGHMEEVINRNENIWSIATNMDAGASVLKIYIDNSSGHIDTALQKYNGALSDSSKKYAKKVLSRREFFKQKLEDPKLIFLNF